MLFRSALVDMRSTTKAFMPPRMTTAERNAINSGTFAAGMVIFNTTTNSLNYYNGTAWMTGVDFGTGSAMAAGTDYLASTAGIVVAHGTKAGGSACNLQGLTDAATTPTTVVAKGFTANTASNAASVTFPVKNGNYYKVTQSSCTLVANFYPILGLAGSVITGATQWNNNVNDINFTADDIPF